MPGKYCSEGHVKAAKGDTHLPGMMRQILQNVSYHNEIITLACTEDHLTSTAMLVASLHTSGYHHTVLIVLEASTGDTCNLKTWPKGVERPTACAWSSAPLPKGDPHDQTRLPFIFHHRHRFNARAARMGYNVMSMDSDVILFHDPYQFLKQGPLSAYHFLVMRDSNGACNCGWYYVQNTSEDGPVSWLINQVPDRYLRFSEDCRKARVFISPDPAKRITPMSNFECGARFGYEQNTLCDAIASFAVGRPLYAHIMNHGGLTGPKAAHFHESNKALFRGFIKGKSSESDAVSSLPLGWKRVVYQDTEHWQASSTSVPTSNGSWPSSLGGRLFGTNRGNFSRHFLKELREDTGRYPSWPDLDFETGEKRSMWSGKERIAFAPGWFVDGWVARGFSGAWDNRLIGGETQQVIGHIINTEGDYQVGKMLIKKALDPNFNWSLNEQRLPFFASTPSTPLPKIILFHPALIPGHIQPFNILDLQDLALFLMTFGKILDRTIVFPSVLCQSPVVPCRSSDYHYLKWSRDHFPYSTSDSFFSFGSLTLESHEDHHKGTSFPAGKWNRTCFWGQFFYSQCFSSGKSLHPVEFQHLIDSDKGPTFSPGISNTLIFNSSDASKLFDMRYKPRTCRVCKNGENEPERIILSNRSCQSTCEEWIHKLNQSGQVIPIIQYSDVIQKAYEMKDEPVIYLGSLAEVSWGSLPTTVQSSIQFMTQDPDPDYMYKGCPGLRRSTATMLYAPWSLNSESYCHW